MVDIDKADYFIMMGLINFGIINPPISDQRKINRSMENTINEETKAKENRRYVSVTEKDFSMMEKYLNWGRCG